LKAFDLTINDLLSKKKQDWYFYEIDSITPDFTEYEGISNTDFLVSST